jgi:hypothetical protein
MPLASACRQNAAVSNVTHVHEAPKSKPRVKQVQNGLPAPDPLQKVDKQASKAVSSGQLVAAEPAEPALAFPATQLEPPAPAAAFVAQALRSEQLAELSAQPSPAKKTSTHAAFIGFGP